MENSKNVVAVRDDLFSQPLLPLDKVRLLGSKCKECGEVMLGITGNCGNCAGEHMETIPLGTKGTLWTYTVIYHRPPGAYKGPDPFVPFAEGLVELPEGIRVLSVLDCDIENIQIGMELELVVFPLYRNEEGQDVIAFKFKAVK